MEGGGSLLPGQEVSGKGFFREEPEPSPVETSKKFGCRAWWAERKKREGAGAPVEESREAQPQGAHLEGAYPAT